MRIRNVIVLTVLTVVLSGIQAYAGMRPHDPAGPRPAGPRPAGPVAAPRHVAPLPPGRPAPWRYPPVGAHRVVVGGIPYWFYGGVYYQLSGDTYVVVSAPVIPVLPGPYSVVIVRGSVYYISDGVYYRAAPGGYLVVERPVETVVTVPAEQPATISTLSETRVIYAPKQSGDGFVPVTLRKLDSGYLGPQGEFYPTMPQVALLTEMYGIPDELKLTRTDVFFIHIPNKDGMTFTRVELKRRDNGFVGPQGEFYPQMPTVAHLVELYGAGQPQAPAEANDAVIRVHVKNKSGDGFVEIELKRHEQGYLGPQGEFYPEMPSAEQLTEVYGSE